MNSRNESITAGQVADCVELAIQIVSTDYHKQRVAGIVYPRQMSFSKATELAMKELGIHDVWFSLISLAFHYENDLMDWTKEVNGKMELQLEANRNDQDAYDESSICYRK